jgi:HEPN domain-containing protein
MQCKEVVREWIERAEEDFGFATSSLELEKYFAQICFHFQQAAEKYLKSFIVANELEFRFVHNLLELLEICKAKESKIGEIEEACRYLNPFYIDTRYPVHWPAHYDKEDAVNARDSAEEVRKWIKGYLGF